MLGKLVKLVSKCICAGLAVIISTCITGCLEPPVSIGDVPRLSRVTVSRVVDGDTVYAVFDDGSEEKIRFIGVDAPEINHPTRGVEPFGFEAEHYARSVLDGEIVWLEFDLGERDQYGRLLAYLWLSRPKEINDQEIREKMFNAHLLLDGYARQVIFLPNIKYVDYFSRYQNEARDQNRGLWGLTAEEITD